MKQAVAVVITDTHLAEGTLEINQSVYSQAYLVCKRVKCNTLLHAGDVFTSRKGQPEIVLNTFKQIVDQAQSQGIMIYAIAGNHDRTHGDSETSFLDAFDGQRGFEVLQAGHCFVSVNQAVAIYLLPYFDLSYTERLEAIIADVRQAPVGQMSILITHVAIDGVKGNNGITAENDLKQNLFDDFDYVLCGHYHDRQILGKKQNIVYIGSTHQATFGEDTNKGCTVIYDDGSIDFIQFDFPQYVTVDILAKDLDNDLITKVREKSTEAKVRIRINDEIDDSKKAMITSLQTSGVKVEVAKQQSFVPGDVTSQVTFDQEDILTIYDEWSADRQIENSEFGKQILTQVL